jgi:hypothetical protein
LTGRYRYRAAVVRMVTAVTAAVTVGKNTRAEASVGCPTAARRVDRLAAASVVRNQVGDCGLGRQRVQPIGRLQIRANTIRPCLDSGKFCFFNISHTVARFVYL